jgi:hypothetical protein
VSAVDFKELIDVLKIIEDYIPVGHPNRPGTIRPGTKARVWHGTGNLNPGAGDTMHRAYVGRKYHLGWMNGKPKFFEANKVTPFRIAGANVFIDKDSAVIVVPLNEPVPGCGDRPLPYQNHTPGIEGYKGQRKLSYDLTRNQNNLWTINIELCMDDMDAWEQVLENAIEFVALKCPDPDVLDVRHFDLTGKVCPAPMVDTSIREVDPRWVNFQSRLAKRLREVNK